MEEEASTSEVFSIPCPLWRRFGAMAYDAILLSCIVFIAWQPVPLLPEIISPKISHAFRLGYLISVCFLFFGWFWCHGGQTLGMRAWRIKLVRIHTPDTDPVTWRMAWMRFISSILSWAVLAIGYFWSVFHPNKLAWHDILSQTKLMVIAPSRSPGR